MMPTKYFGPTGESGYHQVFLNIQAVANQKKSGMLSRTKENYYLKAQEKNLSHSNKYQSKKCEKANQDYNHMNLWTE